MSDDATTLSDGTGDQEHATVKSVLAQAPDEFFEPVPVTLEEVRAFQLNIQVDQDRIEAKRDGDTVSNYYHGRLQMQELQDHLRIEFPETYRSKFRITENFTKSVSKQLSTIYKQKAIREASSKRGKNLTEDQLKEQTELIDFVYQHGKIDRSYQEIERFAKWAKSVLIKVTFQSQTGRTILKPYSPQFYDVMVSESGILQAVIISDYQTGKLTKKQSDARNYWVWTDTEIARYQGSEMNLVESKPNPLERIPFVFFNDDLPVENEKPYLHADTMLSNANLAINRSLTDGMSLIKNKTYGQPWISGGDVDNLPKFSGHEEIWHLIADKDTGNLPTVGMLTPSGDLESILTMVERIANGYATSRGLAPDSFSATKKGSSVGTQSGIALKIKNHVLLEMRESEEAKYQDLENQVFDLVRSIHNFHGDAEGGHDLPDISEDIKLSIRFDDNALAFENPVELRRQQMAEVTAGLLKRSDFVRSARPHLNEEEAIIYLEAVNEENDTLGVIQSIEDIDNILTNNGDTDGDSE